MFLLFFTFLASLDLSYYASTETAYSQGIYKSINSLEEVAPLLKEADDNTVVVFDVDEVLVTTDATFLRPEGEEYFLKLVKDAYGVAKTEKEHLELEDKLSIALVCPRRYLLEPESPLLIDELQRMNKKVIALTSHPTGKFGKIANVERWKVDSLKAFGFHFERSFPQFQNQTFIELQKRDTPSPLYLDGVLFSRGFTKGEVLVAFLQKLTDKPKKVIFIDDLYKNLETVAKALELEHISCIPFWYRRAALKTEDVDTQSIEDTFNNLLKTGALK